MAVRVPVDNVLAPVDKVVAQARRVSAYWSGSHEQGMDVD